MLRAEKRKMAVQVEQISKLKSALFPNESLQERYDNFMPFYLQHGQEFFDTILEAIDATGGKFLVVEE